VVVTSGTAELVTTHRDGGLIASVTTDAGPVVLARADKTVTPGSKVVIGVDGRTPTVHGGD
jgi:hypothetical protein